MSNDPNNTFGTTTIGTMQGFFKDTWADKLGDLIPDGVKVLNKIKFMSKEKQPGNTFHAPVIVASEHGITFAGSDDDAFALNAPISGQTKDATVKGNPMVMRSVIGYTALARAAQGGNKAFMDATKYVVANMLRSASKALEIQMLYGQMGLAKPVAQAAGASFVVQTAEWASGIWAGAEKMPIEIRDVTGATVKTAPGTYVVSVDLEARSVTLSASTTAALLATDVVYRGGSYGKEFPGIHKILTETGSLFGINTSSYNLFKGNSYDAQAGALSFTKLNLAVARAVEKGLDSSLYCLVNPRAWAGMLSDQAAMRKYDQSYSVSKAETGSKSLVFHSQNGDLEIEPSTYVKEGYAFLLAIDEFERVGSSDLSFKIPGSNDQFLLQLPDTAGVEMRLFTDQGLFCRAPGKCVVVHNIVNAE